jgi:adenosylcobinamide-GDP ribazoletransferase
MIGIGYGTAGRLSYNRLAIASQKCHKGRMQDSADRDWARRLSGWFRDLRVAGILLTRLPIRHKAEISSAALSRSAHAFPVIGIGVGLVGAAVFAVAGLIGLGPWLAALAAVAATVLVTGALHEDGLADVADGFGGGADPATKLAIMADSRIGTYGVLALILGVGARIAALAALADSGTAVAALIAAHAVARGALPMVMARQIAVRPDGLAATAGTPAGASATAAAAIAALVAVIALGPASGLLALAFAAATTWLVAGLARRQIGGYTGDVLGALEQMVEIAVLIAVVVAQ